MDSSNDKILPFEELKAQTSSQNSISPISLQKEEPEITSNRDI